MENLQKYNINFVTNPKKYLILDRQENMINFVIPISYGKQFVLDLVKIINSGEYSFNKDYKIVGFFWFF